MNCESYNRGGDNLNGYQNEFAFVMALNNKTKKELNPLLQDLIYFLFGNIPEDAVIKSWRNKEKQKEDILIKVNGMLKGISIKMGSRNSVHVESIKSFVNFLKEMNVSKENIDIFLNYQYAVDENNKKIDAEEYKKQHQKEIDQFNNAINKPEIIEAAIDRFVLKGNNSNYWIAAIVHGTPNDFVWLSKNNIVDVLMKNRNNYSTAIHFSNLVVQPMTRCLNENIKYLFGRKFIQVKWYSLYDDAIDCTSQYIMEKE